MTETLITEVPRRRRAIDLQTAIHNFGPLAILILLMLIAGTMSEVFFSTRNLFNVLRQVAGTGLMAVGMLFIILTRGIDLSVGSVAALGSVAVALMIQAMAPGLAIGLTVLIGMGSGLVSGLLVAKLRLPSFVTTLAAMTIARGASLIASDGQPIRMGHAGDAITAFGAGSFLGVPWPVWLMAAVFLIAGFVLGFTRFGRMVKAIGSNAEAVRLSGIPVARYEIAVYMISGALAALAGVISTSRTGIGSATIGVGAELDAIAAVVIGGASLLGGRGGAANTFIGVFILGVISNIMNLANVPGYHQQVFMGVIIIGAMLLQYGTAALRK